MLWLLTEHFVSPDLWWQMIDPRVLQTGLIKVGVGGGGFAETRPTVRKDGISAFFYISAFGKVHKRLRRLMCGTSSRPCPSLTWPSCLPPAHFGVVSSCLLLWTSSWAPDQDAYLLGVFVKFCAAGTLLCAYQNRLVIVYLLVCSQLDFGLLEGGSYVWFMLPFFVHSLIHKQRESVCWMSEHRISVHVGDLLSGLSSGQMPKPFP